MSKSKYFEYTALTHDQTVAMVEMERFARHQAVIDLATEFAESSVTRRDICDYQGIDPLVSAFVCQVNRPPVVSGDIEDLDQVAMRGAVVAYDAISRARRDIIDAAVVAGLVRVARHPHGRYTVVAGSNPAGIGEVVAALESLAEGCERVHDWVRYRRLKRQVSAVEGAISTANTTLRRIDEIVDAAMEHLPVP